MVPNGNIGQSLIISVHIDSDAPGMYRMRRTGVSVSLLYVGPHDFIAGESCLIYNKILCTSYLGNL